MPTANSPIAVGVYRKLAKDARESIMNEAKGK